MKKVISILLLLVIVLSVSVSASSAEQSNTPEDLTFDLEMLDPKLSLSDAIEQYPAITETYGIVEISEDEAMEAVEHGERLFVLEDDASAREFFASMNCRNPALVRPSE